jgi:hypothetical protein
VTQHVAWFGLNVDHLYEGCPARLRSIPQMLVEWGREGQCIDLVDPEGTDICGWCVRVWRARSKKAANQ